MIFSWKAALLVGAGSVFLWWYPQPSFILLWALTVTSLCLCDAVAALNPRTFTITRQLASPIRADETAQSVLFIHSNTSRTARIEIRDGWAPSLHPSPYSHSTRISPNQPVRLVTTLAPERRGIRTSDYITIRVWGPLGLGARQISVHVPASLDVLPEFRSRRLLPSRLARLQEIEGESAVILRGPGTEFDSLRQYVRGDDPRDIDWKATARAERLIVRTWQPERDRHVLILMDTGRSSALLLGAPQTGKDGDSVDLLDLGVAPRLDANIETALLMAGLADRAGDHVHFVALDQQVHARVQGAKGSHLMNSLARSLQKVSPHTEPIDWSLVEAEVRKNLRQQSLIILLTHVPPAGLDAQIVETIQRLSTSHTVIVADAEDPTVDELYSQRDTLEQIYISAAAASVSRQHAHGVRQIEATGAIVVSVNAGLLAARTADMYVNLKKTGRL